MELIREQSSPLFRIMCVYNAEDPGRRQFDNNISAFHIGQGLVLTVAHHLRTECHLLRSIDENVFVSELMPMLNPAQLQLFSRCYPQGAASGKRYLQAVNQSEVQAITEVMKEIRFDSRWITLMERNICKPHLIIQFTKNQFYNDASLTGHFNSQSSFPEHIIGRHTFLVEAELLEACYSADIALYRMKNIPKEVVDRIPYIDIDFSILDDDQVNFYGLQSAPGSDAGRLLNKAKVEGFLEHFGIFPDKNGGNYVFEGMRYLIRGYFRFGSSGAPYVFYDEERGRFIANAVQSEACPQQLAIANNREGNFQYVNALASPLNIVREMLQKYIPEF